MEEKFRALMGTHHSSRNVSQPSNSVSTNPPRAYEPKWIPTKARCIKSYDESFGQLNTFLSLLLPAATDVAEQLSAKIDDAKMKQIKDIYNHLSKTSINDSFFRNELRKQMSLLRNKLTPGIFSILKKNKGCIISKYKTLYPCRYERGKYIPNVQQRGDYFRDQRCQWYIPQSLALHEFIVVAYIDGVQRKRMIQKLDLKSMKVTSLHKGAMLKRI
uniref:Uncharacterized protein n=1 Tax=Panagrolaimus davidi TaxID=227884 RepID=A0A914P959_9BILA